MATVVQQEKKRKRKDLDAELALFDEEISMVANAEPVEENQVGTAKTDASVVERKKDEARKETTETVQRKKKKKKKKMSEKELMDAMSEFDREVAAPAEATVVDIAAESTVPSVMSSSVPAAVATVQAAPKMFLPQSDMRQFQSQQERGPDDANASSSASAPSYYYQNDAYWQSYGQYGQHDLTSSNVDYNAMLARGNAPEQLPQQQQDQQQQQEQNQKAIKRSAAGKTWEDPILAQFPENDFRLFVGNIGNDVTDDVLARAFQHFPSFAVARIVRDKKSRKSKGYGFVSLLDPNDFLKALDTMNGKYIGNRPCKLKRSKWAERNIDSSKSKKTRQYYS